MLKKDYLDSTENKARQDVMSYLEKHFSSNESIEEGRIILSNKRIKCVQVLNTTEDFNKYDEINMRYLHYVQKKYLSHLKIVNFDKKQEFESAVSTENGKLPMFFIYNNQGEILGLCGFKSLKAIQQDNCQYTANELSSRLVMNAKQRSGLGYGAITMAVMCNYAYHHNCNCCAYTSIQNRDEMFHILNNIGLKHIGIVDYYLQCAIGCISCLIHFI